MSGHGLAQINLSTRPEKSVGSDDIWQTAESALQTALEAKGYPFVVDEGGGAFYGPKIDIKVLPSGQHQIVCVCLKERGGGGGR